MLRWREFSRWRTKYYRSCSGRKKVVLNGNGKHDGYDRVGRNVIVKMPNKFKIGFLLQEKKKFICFFKRSRIGSKKTRIYYKRRWNMMD